MTKLETRYPFRRNLRGRKQRYHSRPRIDYLEDRLLLSVIEDFGSGDLSAYRTIYRYEPSAEVVPGAGHDGVSNALLKHDGYEWMVRDDDGTQVHPGETIDVWTQFADNVDGRIYFGFGSEPYGLVHSPFYNGHTLALVLAGNTSQMMFMANDGNQSSLTHGWQRAPRVLGTPVSQSYDPGQWYQMEVIWGADGTLTGNLYDYAGKPLNTVTASETQITSGGIAFRGFGSDKYFDTVTVNDGTSGSAIRHGGALHGSKAISTLHANPAYVSQPSPLGPGPQGGGSDGTGTPVPWDYTPVPGSGRDIALAAFNQLQQFGRLGDVVALAGANISANVGQYQVSWGPAMYSGSSTSDVAPETPLLAQHVFRQLPGEATTLIGSSDVKHFFSTVSSDYQNLNPGESDPYGSSLNASQVYMLPGSDLDPVTGEMHRPSHYSVVGVDGFDVYVSHGHPSPIEHRLQVNIEDLDPAQNPEGTRWFLMGNLWVAGDQDVTNNSRWVEITPSWNGTTFSFSYPQGAAGQFDFRTIPGLIEEGAVPQIIGQSPSGATHAPVSQLEVRFNRPMDASTFDPSKITSFTGPSGPIDIKGVVPVDKMNTIFDISFASQSDPGGYSMVIGPDIQDTDGVSMSAAYIATFTISSDILINGDFERGDFTGWTQSGDMSYTSVSGGMPHGGRFAAELGPLSEGFLAQTFATTPGQSYTLDYWLTNEGGTPNSFRALIDGVNVPGSVLNNVGAFSYREYMFVFVATGATTELRFGFVQQPAYWHLDDVSINPAGGDGPSGRSDPHRDSRTAAAAAIMRTAEGLAAEQLLAEPVAGLLPARPIEDGKVIQSLDWIFASASAREQSLSLVGVYRDAHPTGELWSPFRDPTLDGGLV
jgi:hypothetical protein